MADVVINLEKKILALAKANEVLSKKTKITKEDLKAFARATRKVDKEFEKSADLLKNRQLSVNNLRKAFVRYSAILNKNEQDTKRHTAAIGKAHEAAVKENRARNKSIESMKRAQMEKLDLINRNKQWTQQLKKAKQQQDIDIHNFKRSTAANIKYEKVLKKLNRTLFTFGKATHRGTAGVRNLRNASKGGGIALSVLRSKLLIVAFGVNLLQRSIGNLVKAYGKQESAEIKVQATLRSTGMAAGMTFSAIKALTTELQRNGVVGDEVNLQMSSLMLTYDQIGKEVFPSALKAANDMATSLAMNIPTAEELKSTVTMLAKALQEPERGMAALRKVGFSLSAAQAKQVTQFMHLNKTAEAQKIIIKAANKQYGDMADIIAKSTLGQLNAMNMALGDMGEELGSVLAPIVLKVANGIKFLAESADPSTLRGFTKSLVALTAVLLVAKVRSTMLASAYQVQMVAAAGATITTNQLAAAQARINALMLKNPYIVLGGIIIATLIPALKGLTGAYKDAGNEAKRTADKHLDLMNALGGTPLKQLEGEFKIFEEVSKTLGKSLEDIQTQFDIIQSSGTMPQALNDATDSLYELIPGLKDLVNQSDDWMVRNAILRSETIKFIKDLELQTGSLERNAYVRQILIDLIKAQKQESEEQHIIESIDAYKAKSKILELQSNAYLTNLTLLKATQTDLGALKTKVFGLTKAEKKQLAVDLELQKVATKRLITVKQLKAEHPKLAAAIKKTTEAQEDFNEEQERMAKFKEQLTALTQDIKTEFFANEIAMADAQIEKQNEVMENDIENAKKSSAYKLAQAVGDAKTMEKIEKNARKASLPARIKAFEEKQSMAKHMVNIDSAVAIMKGFADFGWLGGAIVMGLLLVKRNQQIQQIKAQKAPSYQRGGIIGGRRHTQGGTMIEAEQGEFIIKRDIVEKLGLPTMRAINSGNKELIKEKIGKFEQGGLVTNNTNIKRFQEGGNIDYTPPLVNVSNILTTPEAPTATPAQITINISGNVMSPDYVEGELAEQIKNAVRRGTDFGLS